MNSFASSPGSRRNAPPGARHSGRRCRSSRTGRKYFPRHGPQFGDVPRPHLVRAVPPARVSDPGRRPGHGARGPAPRASAPGTSWDRRQVDALSSRIAQAWGGDLSANRSLSSTASSASCPAAVSAAGCGARGPAGAFPAAGAGLRWRCSVARDFPSNSHALFTQVSGSSSANAASVTSAASRLSPRSRRAAPRARALFPPLQARLSSGSAPR